MWVDLIDMLNADDATLLDRYGRWYIADRDPRWLRRNALICVGNTASPTDIEAREVVERYRDGDDDLLAEHARWALAQIASR
jgi:epoxyqueuosine reductase